MDCIELALGWVDRPSPPPVITLLLSGTSHGGKVVLDTPLLNTQRDSMSLTSGYCINGQPHFSQENVNDVIIDCADPPKPKSLFSPWLA